MKYVNSGQERWERYHSVVLNREMIQYDYRTPDGELFSTVARTLDIARLQRDKWLRERILRKGELKDE
jgi:hypothetical protein